MDTQDTAAVVVGEAVTERLSLVHKVEVVAACIVQDVHRVVGEIVMVAEHELGNLLESGRGKVAAPDAVVGVPTPPIEASTEAKPAEQPPAALPPAAT